MPASTVTAPERLIDDIDLVRRAAQKDRSAIKAIIKSSALPNRLVARRGRFG